MLRLTLALCVACSVDVPDDTFGCSSDDDCPRGLRCTASFLCSRALDAAAGRDGSVDGAVDAPIDAAGDAAIDAERDGRAPDVPGFDAPTDGGPIPMFTSICTGDEHSCAVDDGGSVWCWGSDARGQLGDGTAGDESLSPARVDSLVDVSRVYCGAHHTCAIHTDGDGSCWGDGSLGQLGQGARSSSAEPVAIAGGERFVKMALGTDHTCAILVGDTVACWGDSGQGQLGLGPLTDATEPQDVPGLGGVMDIAAGDAFTCIVKASSPTAMCWGANRAGQLGDGTNDERNTPVEALGLDGASRIASGRQHACALVGEFAWCWGENSDGQIGNGTTTPENTPQLLTGAFNRFTANVWAGGASSFAVRMGGLRAWGDNASGQLGDGTVEDRPTAVSPLVALTAEQVAPSVGHTCALTSGVVSCWGSNTAGQLGDGTNVDSIDAAVRPFD